MKLVDGLAGNTEVERLVADGRPILVMGRWSDGGGRSGVKKAVADLFDAVQGLRVRFGLDVASVLPDRATLATDLWQQELVWSQDRSGQRFGNRFLTLDLVAEHGVVIALSAGSGQKTDEMDRQPAIEYHANCVRRFRPALTWATSSSRYGRASWGLKPLAEAIEHTGGLIGTLKRAPMRAEGVNSLILFFDGGADREEARDIFAKTRRGMARGTDERMVDGRARLSAPASLPPGLCRVRLRDQGRRGTSLVCLESPANLPPKAEVATGYPDVVDDDGVVVDQVGNVRRILRGYAAGMTLDDIAAEAVAHSYSTDAMRSRSPGRSAARYSVDNLRDRGGHSILRGILSNLDLYRTGELRLGLGAEEHPDVVVTGCFPTDGPWLSDEGWKAIDRRREVSASRTRTAVRLTFVGTQLLLRVDGDEQLASLQANDRGKAEYQFTRPWSPGSLRTSLTRARLPASEFARVLVDAIGAAGTAALSLVPVPEDDEETRADRMLALDLRARVSQLRGEADQIRQRVLSGAVTDELLASLNELHNTRANEVKALESELDAVGRRIEGARLKRAGSKGEVAAAGLLQLVASLGDPEDRTHRAMWLATIRDLAVDIEACRYAGRRGFRMRVRGQLAVGGDDDRLLSIPFDAVCEDRAVLTGRRAVADALDELRRGVPWPQLEVPFKGDVQKELRHQLGFEDRLRGRALFNCLDSRVLRIAMAVVDPDRSLTAEDAAHELGEDVELGERVVASLTRPAPSWLSANHPGLAWAYRCAATTPDRVVDARTFVADGIGPAYGFDNLLRKSRTFPGWQRASGRRLVLPACGWCGSRQLVPLRLVEVSGPVCTTCERDHAGTVWPLAVYGRWAHELERTDPSHATSASHDLRD